MKNLYKKSRSGGRICPSPVSDVLKLLPSFILALTAVLTDDDKEVLAYLIIRSASGDHHAGEKRRWEPGGPHRSALGCWCFDCYTSFWSRWDESPHRDVIDFAIEAFDDHLSSSERCAKPRRREKIKNSCMASPKKKEDAMEGRGEAMAAADTSQSCSSAGKEAAAESVWYQEKDDEICEEEMEVGFPMPEPRRSWWSDVFGLLQIRSWNLWAPLA